MSNLPVLWRNTLAGLSDDAGGLYLRGAARDELRAFRMSCKWQDRLELLLPRLIEKAAGGPCDSLLHFMRERHFRKYFPDGRSA